LKVGTRLAILRTVREWTQEDLARRAGIRPGTVSDYERGKMVPGLLALQRLLDAMGYRLSDLEAVGDFLGKLGRVPPVSAPSDLAEEIQAAATGLGEYLGRVVRLALVLLGTKRGAVPL
jgi:transcriptional regulator with XRE-family HTH domain